MAHSITLAKEYMAELDKVYKYVSKTAVLDTPAAQIRPGTKANEVLIAKMSLQGLGEYDKATGYVSGDETLTWETLQLTQDRGRKFNIDAMDNLETSMISFGMLAGEFIRTKVVPEFDAYRMASYFASAGSTTSADFTTGAEVLAAIDAAMLAMDNAEVPEEGRILFLSTACASLLKGVATLTRNVGQVDDGSINRDAKGIDLIKTIVKMPPTRFYTAITQYDGSSSGQEAGGYIKNASTGKDLNFQIIHPSAVLQTVKHTVNKIITPEDNQTSDGWLYFYRAYHDALVYDNKTDGIYAHYKTT